MEGRVSEIPHPISSENFGSLDSELFGVIKIAVGIFPIKEKIFKCQGVTQKFTEIYFTNMETLIDILSVKVGDTVGEYGRKTTLSPN